MNHSAIVIGFTGACADAVTVGIPLGNGYRCYLPGLMRFNAPDTLSPFDAGGPNPYVYCADDPVDRIDPSGHVNWSVTGKLLRRFLTRLGARRKSRAISAAIATQDVEEAVASGAERGLRSNTSTLERAPTHPMDESQPGRFELEAIREMPNAYLVRPVTLLEKIAQLTDPKLVLAEHVFVHGNGGKPSMLSFEAFRRDYDFNESNSLHTRGAADTSDRLTSSTRVCFPKRQGSSVTAKPPAPRWSLPQTDARPDEGEDSMFGPR